MHFFITALVSHKYKLALIQEKSPALKTKTAQTVSLRIWKLVSGDSGVYFCAMNQHKCYSRVTKSKSSIQTNGKHAR